MDEKTLVNSNIWVYNSKPITDVPTGYIGFIYRITNIDTGRMYIGKKNFFSTVTKTKTVLLKSGTKKKKRIKVTTESDWRDYYGSSEELCLDVQKIGAESFSREILHLCKTKGELSYKEAEYQFNEKVLLSPDLYYNSWISVRVRRAHLKHLI